MSMNLSEAFATPTEIDLPNGAKLKASPLAMADFAELEKQFHEERCPDPVKQFEESLEKLKWLGIEIDPKAAFEQVQLAFRERADRPDIFSVEGQAWLGTMRGKIAVLTLSFRKCHPDITEDLVLLAIQALGAEAKRAMDAALERDSPKSGSSRAASSGQAQGHQNRKARRARQKTGA